MSRPVVFNWPAADTQAICLTQNLAGAGNLLINGHLATNNQVTFDRIVRQISFTSTNDLSGVEFTITGTDFKGKIITEIVDGPDAETVYSLLDYSSISSISASNAAAGISVGSGPLGQTQWYQLNYHATAFPIIAYQVVIPTGVTLTSSIQATLDDVTTTDVPFMEAQQSGMSSSTLVTNGFFMARYVCFTVDNGTTNGSAVFTLLQQGIT